MEILADFKTGIECIQLINDGNLGAEYAILIAENGILKSEIRYVKFDNAKVEFNQQMHFRVNRL